MSFSDLKLKKYGLLFFKALIGLSTFFFLFKAVFGEGEPTDGWLLRLAAAFQSGAGGPIVLAAVLIPLNWGLEAAKWQLLSRKVEQVTWLQAYRAVLVGICLGFITPNRVGDYAGRIIELKSRHRLQALGAVFLGRFCQLVLTLTAGSAGIFYFCLHTWTLPVSGLLPGIGVGLVVLNGGAYLVLFHPRLLVGMAAATPFLKRFLPYLSIISRYHAREMAWLVAWSALRYLVFLSQFLLLLWAFGIQTDGLAMAMGVACTFLLKSVLPSFNAFTDLGMRELSAMYFFSLLQQDKVLVMSASLSLWLLNIAVPSLIGLILVWQIKLKSLSDDPLKKNTDNPPGGRNKRQIRKKQAADYE